MQIGSPKVDRPGRLTDRQTDRQTGRLDVYEQVDDLRTDMQTDWADSQLKRQPDGCAGDQLGRKATCPLGRERSTTLTSAPLGEAIARKADWNYEEKYRK